MNTTPKKGRPTPSRREAQERQAKAAAETQGWLEERRIRAQQAAAERRRATLAERAERRAARA